MSNDPSMADDILGDPPEPSPPRHGYTVSFVLDVSLRDYFAGQALLAVSNWRSGSVEREPEEAAKMWGLLGRDSYAVADAMLKERDAKNAPAESTKPATPFLRESKVYLYLELQRFMKGFEEVGQDSNSETFRQALDVLWYGMMSTERAAVEGKK